jgi:HTH-type transcriptional regulator / antitoxin MqsA
VHVGDDMQAVGAALRDLKRQVDGVPTPDAIRALRKKLGLSQRAAGDLFKVGPNAFDKYERGLVAPSGPTVQLMRVLDRRPELVGELGE